MTLTKKVAKLISMVTDDIEKLEFVSDSALIVRFAGEISKETTARVLSLFHTLMRSSLPFSNLHPAYDSLMIDWSLEQLDPNELWDQVVSICKNKRLQFTDSSRRIEIPVHYGGADGPDLEELAAQLKVSPKEIIQLHSESEYTVAFLGFSPGFPYLLGLPPKLECQRKSTPRIRVPAGSVGIAGKQTGVYPSESAGGWQLIGRTSVRLFDPSAELPTALAPGDRIQFVPIDPSPKTREHNDGYSPSKRDNEILVVEEPGFYSTLQNQGFRRLAHLGISMGGAADPLAHRVGQWLVANQEIANALEITGCGGRFRFLKDTWIALTGSPCEARLDQLPLALWTSIPVCAGQILEIGSVHQGLRTYLNVHGGCQNSSTKFERSALHQGEILFENGLAESAPGFRTLSSAMTSYYNELQKAHITLRVTEGPNWNSFTSASQTTFFTNPYQVTNDVNRNGIRMQGAALELKPEIKAKEILSEGTANGALQIPLSGQPLLLFCEQRTTGGYPKIANVIRADWHLMGQLKSGHSIQFQKVSLSDSWNFSKKWEDSLQNLLVQV